MTPRLDLVEIDSSWSRDRRNLGRRHVVSLMAMSAGGLRVTISQLDEVDFECVFHVVSTTGDRITLEQPHVQDTDRVAAPDMLGASMVPLQRAPDGLTGREREVASLLALGLSNRRIADQLVIAEKTAKNHVQRVLEKLGVRSRAEVAARADELGLRRREVAHAALF